MARTKWNPEVGSLPANKGGTHGGINPAGGKLKGGFSTPGQKSGNPGNEFPWSGSDATDIGANTALPPCKYPFDC